MKSHIIYKPRSIGYTSITNQITISAFRMSYENVYTHNIENFTCLNCGMVFAGEICWLYDRDVGKIIDYQNSDLIVSYNMSCVEYQIKQIIE